MSERYATAEELARELERGTKTVVITAELYDAIIARLRAADALCAAAGDLENLAKQLMKETEESYNEDAELADIRKAIAEYEEG